MFRKGIRLLGRLLLVVGVVWGLYYLTDTGGWVRALISAVFGWAVLLYLIWRAWPAMVADARRVRLAVPQRRRGEFQ